MARILVVFSSLFGANADLAAIVRPVLTGLGAQVRIRGVPQLVLSQAQAPAARATPATGEDLSWADGYILTSSVHTGLLSASMKAFIDEHHDAAETGAFIDKTFTAMATGAYLHAGQERVVDELNAVGAIWGCVLVPPSGADAAVNSLNGNPWGLTFTLRHGRIDERQARQPLRQHLTRFVHLTDTLASARLSEPGQSRGARLASDGGADAGSSRETGKDQEGISMSSPSNPLRVADVFDRLAPHRSGSSGSSGFSGSSGEAGSSDGGAGGHYSPSHPLRVAEVFDRLGSGGAPPRRSSSGSGSSGSGSSDSGRAGGGRGSGGGHTPQNPLRATDVF